MRFRATILLGGKTATGIRVPDEIVAGLGHGRRPPVRVTIGGHNYRSTVASRGGEFMLSLSAENRERAGVAAGDEVDVDVELDTEPRAEPRYARVAGSRGHVGYPARRRRYGTRPLSSFTAPKDRTRKPLVKEDPMVRAGDVIENPVTRERIVFLKTARDTGGEVLAFEYLVPPRTPGPPLHVHPFQEERFVEILSGTLCERLGKEERSVGEGEGFAVPPGTPHAWRNDGGEEVRMLVEIRPALRMEEVFETTFDLAREGKTNAKGIPRNPLQAAATAREYSDELRLTRPPFIVQRVLFGLLASVGGWLGYEGRHPKRGAGSALTSWRESGS